MALVCRFEVVFPFLVALVVALHVIPVLEHALYACVVFVGVAYVVGLSTDIVKKIVLFQQQHHHHQHHHHNMAGTWSVFLFVFLLLLCLRLVVGVVLYFVGHSIVLAICVVIGLIAPVFAGSAGTVMFSLPCLVVVLAYFRWVVMWQNPTLHFAIHAILLVCDVYTGSCFAASTVESTNSTNKATSTPTMTPRITPKTTPTTTPTQTPTQTPTLTTTSTPKYTPNLSFSSQQQQQQQQQQQELVLLGQAHQFPQFKIERHLLTLSHRTQPQPQQQQHQPHAQPDEQAEASHHKRS